MQIVIDIPEDEYKCYKHYRHPNDAKEFTKIMIERIAKGIPLPEGHGKLFDENDFEKRIAVLTESMDLGYGEIMDVFDEISPILNI